MSNRPVVAPYVTAWTAEQDQPYRIVTASHGGIAYADESTVDRDRHGVLWSRTPNRPGEGRPDFGRVHPLRQRRAMQRLLCQVCAGPANHTDDGVLWLLRDFRDDWPGWPNRMGVTEPPICLPCVPISLQRCPALRKGAVTIRARHYPIAGVYGALHTGPRLTATDAVNLPLDDPQILWIRAFGLIRELNCTTIAPPHQITTEWAYHR